MPNNLTHSPINVHALLPLLAQYKLVETAIELAEGFHQGFKLGFQGKREARPSKNLQSIKLYPAATKSKIKSEIDLKRISGPYKEPPFNNFMSSPIGLVPKREPGKFQLIQHLSWPEGKSINDSIDPTLCAVKYARFDDAITLIQKTGVEANLAKCDVKSAFRLLPVHPNDYELLGFTFEGSFFFDMAMPMGCSISCSTWEKFGTFIEWAVRRVSPSGFLLHYIDDFLFIGKKGTSDCSTLMANFHSICQTLGVPIAPEKRRDQRRC